MRQSFQPPAQDSTTANCQHQDPACAINVQPLIAKPATLSTIMSNSLGFWGYQASLIFQKNGSR
jgi:3-oxoacyl-(acyl-carrier-protein) synthase